MGPGFHPASWGLLVSRAQRPCQPHYEARAKAPRGARPEHGAQDRQSSSPWVLPPTALLPQLRPELLLRAVAYELGNLIL